MNNKKFIKGAYSVLCENIRSINTVPEWAQPNLVFAEATPVIGPNYIEPCEEYDPRPICNDPPPGDDEPDNDNPGCTEHVTRGSAGGPTAGTQTYFDLLHLRLYDTGNGDGAAELQMFVRNDDDYAGECLNMEYKYRFDLVYRGGNYDTLIDGADGVKYFVPDVNQDGVDYKFNELPVFGTDLTYSQGFPLFDLTNRRALGALYFQTMTGIIKTLPTVESMNGDKIYGLMI